MKGAGGRECPGRVKSSLSKVIFCLYLLFDHSWNSSMSKVDQNEKLRTIFKLLCRCFFVIIAQNRTAQTLQCPSI